MWAVRVFLVIAVAFGLSACGSKFKTYNDPEVTRVEVHKADRKMYLFHNDRVLKSYDIALGFAPDEAKIRAFMVYSYEVAESLLGRQGTPAQKQARSAFVERLMLQRLQVQLSQRLSQRMHIQCQMHGVACPGVRKLKFQLRRGR